MLEQFPVVRAVVKIVYCKFKITYMYLDLNIWITSRHYTLQVRFFIKQKNKILLFDLKWDRRLYFCRDRGVNGS